MEKKRVAIVVLNYNRREMLLRCLDSIFRQDHPVFKVILVDNHSSDGSVEAVRQTYPSVEIIRNDRNYGASGGKNIGLRHAMKEVVDWVYLVDNDIIVEKNTLVELIKVTEIDPKVGVVGSKIYNLDNPHELYGAGVVLDYTQNVGHGRGRGEIDEGQYDRTEEVEVLLGGSLLIRMDVLRSIGLFDTDFLGYWYEAQDFCLRAVKAGFKVYFAHRSKVWHKPPAEEYSFHKKYLTTRNALRFMEKHGRPRTWMKYLFYSIVGFGYALVRETPRGNFMGVVGKAKGLFDGLLGRDEPARKMLLKK
ncbi:MAG: glycosyltransferase family 2 protein [bacterium]